MIKPFRLDVSRVSSFGGVKRAKSFGLPLNKDSGNPALPILAPSNTSKTASVVLSRPQLVLHVAMTGYVAKVRKAVIGLISIDMVDFLHRPVASHVKPCEAVDGVDFAANHDVEVASLIRPSATASALGGKSRENATLGVVMHKLAQTFGSKVSHVCLHHGHQGNFRSSGDEPLVRPLRLDRTHTLQFNPI